MPTRRRARMFVAALALGAVIFSGGFRLTSEVIPVLGTAILAGGSMVLFTDAGLLAGGLGVALGTQVGSILVPEPPLSPEHIAQEGRSRPLPLPFGLTPSAMAQRVAGGSLIVLIVFVPAVVVWLLKTAFAKTI